MPTSMEIAYPELRRYNALIKSIKFSERQLRDLEMRGTKTEAVERAIQADIRKMGDEASRLETELIRKKIMIPKKT